MDLMEMPHNLKTFRISDNVPTDPIHPYRKDRIYQENDEVQIGRWVYRSVSLDNLGNQPDLESSATKWRRKRPINEDAYLTYDVSSKSLNTSLEDPTVLEFSIEAFTFLMLTGLVGEKVDLKITKKNDDSFVILEKTVYLSSPEMEMDWYIFFRPTLRPVIYTDRIIEYIEQGYDQKIKITIHPDTNRNGSAIGALIMNVPFSAGCTLNSVKKGFKSNSKTAYRDNILQIEKVNGYRRMDVDVWAKDKNVDTVMDLLERYMDNPMVIIALKEYRTTVLYCIFKDGDMSIDNMSTYTLSVESMEAISDTSKFLVPIDPRETVEDRIISTVDDWNEFFNVSRSGDIEINTSYGFEYFNKRGVFKSDRFKRLNGFKCFLTTDSSDDNLDESLLLIEYADGTQVEIIAYNDKRGENHYRQRSLKLNDTFIYTEDSLVTNRELSFVFSDENKIKDIDYIIFNGNRITSYTNQQIKHQYIKDLTFFGATLW